MDLASIAAIISTVEQIIVVAAPAIEKGIENAKPFAQIIYDVATGQTTTDAQLATALASANALSAQIQDPNFIPAAQSDDV